MNTFGNKGIDKWRVLDPDDLHDSLVWSDREPLPRDNDASVFRPSNKVGLLGLLTEDLERSRRQYPRLSPAMAFLDRRGRVRVAQLPREKSFGEHVSHPGYSLAAITLAPYVMYASMGISAYGETFIQPGGEFDEGSIATFGVQDITIFVRTHPQVPIFRRPTQG
jgi:hypothetical protein